MPTTEEKISTLLDEKLSYKEIAALVGVAPSTVSGYAGKLNKRRGVLRHDWAKVQQRLDSGEGITTLCRDLNISWGAVRCARKSGRLKDVRRKPIPISELFATKRIISSTYLKRRMVSSKCLENKCKECGVLEWRGHDLSLQLDHIDGNRRNNEQSNLRLLCPNCHSITATFAGRNLTNPLRARQIKGCHEKRGSTPLGSPQANT